MIAGSRVAVHAVCVNFRSKLLAHGIVAQHTADYADRCYHKVEHTAQDDSRVAPTEDIPQKHPLFIDPR
jgi:hypothetical protein